MQHDRPILISSAGSRKATRWPTQSIMWGELVQRLASPVRGAETHAAYMAMTKAQQDDLKDVGGYASDEVEGYKDADLFYKRVRDAGGEPLVWVIDAEEGCNTKSTVRATCERLRELVGNDAVWFYSFDSRCRSWADLMELFDGVWSARWNNPDIAPGYKDYSLWQYGYTNVPGIGSKTDTSKLPPNTTLAQVLARRARRT